MGRSGQGLQPGAIVHVRFEGGTVVSAVVKWNEDDLVGLAFDEPLILDGPAQPAN